MVAGSSQPPCAATTNIHQTIRSVVSQITVRACSPPSPPTRKGRRRSTAGQHDPPKRPASSLTSFPVTAFSFFSSSAPQPARAAAHQPSRARPAQRRSGSCCSASASAHVVVVLGVLLQQPAPLPTDQLGAALQLVQQRPVVDRVREREQRGVPRAHAFKLLQHDRQLVLVRVLGLLRYHDTVFQILIP